MNILVCPDSFKGSISSSEFCLLAKEILTQKFPLANITTRPLADGGENTLECLYPSLWNAEIKWVETYDPLLRPIKASYIIYQSTAYIELAGASGLTLIPENERDVMHSTTFGTGLLIRHAIEHGIKKVLLFVGGSATNDGGIGIAHALGAQFYDYDGFNVIPDPSNIHRIADIENSFQFSDVEFIVATDVKNPLLGDDGAARIYSPQKGASEKQVDLLEEAMRHYEELLESYSGKKFSEIEGMGAAGGTALSLVGLFNGQIISAVDLILELIDFTHEFEDADIVITGEGSFDSQSLSGKIVGKIVMECVKKKKKCIIVAGSRKLSMVSRGVKHFDLMKKGMKVDEAIDHAHSLLKDILLRLEIE